MDIGPTIVLIIVVIGFVGCGIFALWEWKHPPAPNYSDGLQAQRDDLEHRQLVLTSNIVYHLRLMEQLVYLSPGDSVRKDTLLQIMMGLARALTRKESDENTQGSPVYRHGNNGLEPSAEQTIISWARGLEERPSSESPGDSSLGRGRQDSRSRSNGGEQD